MTLPCTTCQQAAEKALKAYLSHHASPFAKTHALAPLVEQATMIDSAFASLLETAEDLSPFAWRFRYPGELLAPTEDETRRAIEMAAQVIDFVSLRLPNEALPEGRSFEPRD